MAKKQNITFIEGNEPDYTIHITRDGSDVDLTGSTFYMTVKSNNSYEDDMALFKKTITSLPQAEQGIVTIHIDREDTLGKDLGSYYYDIVWKNNSGDIITLVYGNFYLISTTTRTV